MPWHSKFVPQKPSHFLRGVLPIIGKIVIILVAKPNLFLGLEGNKISSECNSYTVQFLYHKGSTILRLFTNKELNYACNLYRYTLCRLQCNQNNNYTRHLADERLMNCAVMYLIFSDVVLSVGELWGSL